MELEEPIDAENSNRRERLLQQIVDMREAVVRFARDDLLCGCPQRVFDSIRLLFGLEELGAEHIAIVVGERLLIVFVNYRSLEPFAEEVPALIQAGVAYRDAHDLNRVRFVFELDTSPGHRRFIREIVERSGERVHVHFQC